MTCHDLHVAQIRGVSGAGTIRLHVAVYESDEAASTLPAPTVVTLPGAGHGVLYGSACGGRLVSAFLDAPASELDTRCADEMERPHFEP